MAVDTDQELLDLLMRPGPADDTAVTAREGQLRLMYQHTDGLAQRIIEVTWAEAERDRDITRARAVLGDALEDVERALIQADAAAETLVDCYDPEFVEGRAQHAVGEATRHMRLLVDAARYHVDRL